MVTAELKKSKLEKIISSREFDYSGIHIEKVALSSDAKYLADASVFCVDLSLVDKRCKVKFKRIDSQELYFNDGLNGCAEPVFALTADGKLIRRRGSNLIFNNSSHELAGPIQDIAISSDGNFISVCYDSLFYRKDMKSNAVHEIFEVRDNGSSKFLDLVSGLYADDIFCFKSSFSPDNNYLGVLSSFKKHGEGLLIFKKKGSDFECVNAFGTDLIFPKHSFGFGANNEIFIRRDSESILYFDMPEEEKSGSIDFEILTFPEYEELRNLSLSPDGKYLAVVAKYKEDKGIRGASIDLFKVN